MFSSTKPNSPACARYRPVRSESYSVPCRATAAVDQLLAGGDALSDGDLIQRINRVSVTDTGPGIAEDAIPPALNPETTALLDALRSQDPRH